MRERKWNLYRTQKYEKQQQSFFDSSFQGNDGGVSSKKKAKKSLFMGAEELCVQK